jgi:Surface antigen variable number repeat
VARAGACLLAALIAAVVQAEEDLRIGTITIRTLDIFDAEESAAGWAYRAANALHASTRESFIQRLLLFQEGDPFDPEALAETERNLRALGLFKSVSVTASPPHDGLVDVEVTTQDTWTLQIKLLVGRDGGQMRQGVALGERNLLGTGRQLAVALGSDSDRAFRSVELYDPHLWTTYGGAHLLYSDRSDGHARVAELDRPFYSIRTPWAAAAGVSDVSREQSLYHGGEETSRFRLDTQRYFARYAIALRPGGTRALRLGVGLDWQEDRFGAVPGHDGEALPADRRFRYVFLELEAIRSDFLTWNYVNRDLREEDFNLGGRIALTWGISPAAFGAPRTSQIVRLQVEKGARLGPSAFLLGSFSGETRLEDRPRNTIVSGQLLFVRRFATTLPQTFLARLEATAGWNLDGDVQFFADGATGLRAYPLHAFEGNRRVILNLEHRIFSARELFRLVSPGLALFVDAGTAVPPGEPLRLSRFKVDAGIGLRFAIARASTVFRVDAAYAFQPDPRGRGGWLISFSGGQAF